MVQVREDYKIVRKLREEWKRVTGKEGREGLEEERETGECQTPSPTPDPKERRLCQPRTCQAPYNRFALPWEEPVQFQILRFSTYDSPIRHF